MKNNRRNRRSKRRGRAGRIKAREVEADDVMETEKKKVTEENPGRKEARDACKQESKNKGKKAKHKKKKEQQRRNKSQSR